MSSDVKFDFPDDLLLDLEKITSPRPALDAKQLYKKEKLKTRKLQKFLAEFRTSARNLVQQHKAKEVECADLKSSLNQCQVELEVEQQKYIALENSFRNEIFKKEQEAEELKYTSQTYSADHINLAKDYLTLLGEVTLHNNYIIDKARNKIIKNTESFVKKHDTKFKAKIFRTYSKKLKSSSSNYDSDSCSSSLTSNPIAIQKWIKSTANSKLKSPDVLYDSAINSPVSQYSIEITNDETDIPKIQILEDTRIASPRQKTARDQESVDFTHNYCATKAKSPAKTITETENLDLWDDTLGPEIEDFIEEDLKGSEEFSQLINSLETDSFVFEDPSVENRVENASVQPSNNKFSWMSEDVAEESKATEAQAQNTPITITISPPRQCDCEKTKKAVITTSTGVNTDFEFMRLPDLPNLLGEIGESRKETATKSTNTTNVSTQSSATLTDPPPQTSVMKERVEKIDQGTSPIKVSTKDQSVTVKFPSVTRGTLTEKVKTKSLGTMFPEPEDLSIDKILADMRIDFELEPLLEPIQEISTSQLSSFAQTSPIKKCSIKTITELQNVTKQIDYVEKIKNSAMMKIKKEKLSPATSLNNLFLPREPSEESVDEPEFSLIGHVMYDIFDDLIQQRRFISKSELIQRILDGVSRFRNNLSLGREFEFVRLENVISSSGNENLSSAFNEKSMEKDNCQGNAECQRDTINHRIEETNEIVDDGHVKNKSDNQFREATDVERTVDDCTVTQGDCEDISISTQLNGTEEVSTEISPDSTQAQGNDINRIQQELMLSDSSEDEDDELVTGKRQEKASSLPEISPQASEISSELCDNPNRRLSSSCSDSSSSSSENPFTYSDSSDEEDDPKDNRLEKQENSTCSKQNVKKPSIQSLFGDDTSDEEEEMEIEKQVKVAKPFQCQIASNTKEKSSHCDSQVKSIVVGDDGESQKLPLEDTEKVQSEEKEEVEIETNTKILVVPEDTAAQQESHNFLKPKAVPIRRSSLRKSVDIQSIFDEFNAFRSLNLISPIKARKQSLEVPPIEKQPITSAASKLRKNIFDSPDRCDSITTPIKITEREKPKIAKRFFVPSTLVQKKEPNVNSPEISIRSLNRMNQELVTNKEKEDSCPLRLRSSNTGKFNPIQSRVTRSSKKVCTTPTRSSKRLALKSPDKATPKLALASVLDSHDDLMGFVESSEPDTKEKGNFGPVIKYSEIEKPNLKRNRRAIRSLANSPDPVDSSINFSSEPNLQQEDFYDDCPKSPDNFLEFDFDFEAPEIPLESSVGSPSFSTRKRKSISDHTEVPSKIFGKTVSMELSRESEDVEEPELQGLSDPQSISSDSPASPPPYELQISSSMPITIPLSPQIHSNTDKSTYIEKILQFHLEFNTKIHEKAEFSQEEERKVLKIRKYLRNYLEADWNLESVENCIKSLEKYLNCPKLLVASIWETLEDHITDEISFEMTPPAPPMPHHQQKLLLIVQQLSQVYPEFPNLLLQHLESIIFRVDSQSEILYLENVTYFWTGLIDLFFDGDTNEVYYFIYKCLYFHMHFKAIAMIFVVIKAFPDVLPKKAQLLDSYDKDGSWLAKDHFEVGRETLDLNRIDPLVATFIHLLTNTNQYRGDDPSKDHEFYNFYTKFYNFWINFVSQENLLKILVNQLNENRFKNVSFSLILLAKRTTVAFKRNIILKRNLLPLLKKSIKAANEVEPKKLIVLVESISSITKCFAGDSDIIFKEIFQLFVELLHKCENVEVQENCVRALLRLHKVHGDLREIYRIIKEWNPQFELSDNLQTMISTFVNRKHKRYFCTN